MNWRDNDTFFSGSLVSVGMFNNSFGQFDERKDMGFRIQNPFRDGIAFNFVKKFVN